MNDDWSYGLSDEEVCGTWIPVSKRLPVQGHHVIVSTHNSVFTAYRGTPPMGMSVIWKDGCNGLIVKERIYAWMPLPKCYVEKC